MNNLEVAINDVKVLKTPIREAARKNGVNYNTLYRHNKYPVILKQGRQPLFTSIENEKLLEYINFCVRRGCPRSPQDVREAAFIILQLRLGEKARKPGEVWLRKFLKDNNLCIRKSKKLSKSSAVVSKEDIYGWFDRCEEALKSEEIFDILLDPSRVVNADETFLLFNPSQSKVVAPIGTKNIFDIQGKTHRRNLKSSFKNLLHRHF